MTQKRCYCETVKNLTVSLPDDVYRNARIAAARRDTSVSALVVAYLRGLSDRMDEFSRLEALQHEIQAEIGQFRAADRLGRDELHGRGA
jgi:plasmid stability protein